MRAIICPDYGPPEILRVEERPEPVPGPGQVLVQHKAWADLFSAYTFQGGNLWPLVLAVTLLAPWVAARLRGRVQASGAAGMERRT